MVDCGLDLVVGCLLSVGLVDADFAASRLGLLVAGCLVWLRVYVFVSWLYGLLLWCIGGFCVVGVSVVVCFIDCYRLLVVFG